MSARRKAWAIGYAKQAKADFDALERLKDFPELPECQSLHFLQMACEKLCKAHLCWEGTDPEVLQTSHAFISGNLPVIAREQYGELTGKSLRARSFELRRIGQIAREIELLAPQVTDGGRRPDNCEYPWEDQGRLFVPAESSFPNLDLLGQPAGRILLKLITAAIDDLLAPDRPT